MSVNRTLVVEWLRGCMMLRMEGLKKGIEPLVVYNAYYNSINAAYRTMFSFEQGAPIHIETHAVTGRALQAARVGVDIDRLMNYGPRGLLQLYTKIRRQCDDLLVQADTPATRVSVFVGFCQQLDHAHQVMLGIYT